MSRINSLFFPLFLPFFLHLRPIDLHQIYRKNLKAFFENRFSKFKCKKKENKKVPFEKKGLIFVDSLDYEFRKITSVENDMHNEITHTQNITTQILLIQIFLYSSDSHLNKEASIRDNIAVNNNESTEKNKEIR